MSDTQPAANIQASGDAQPGAGQGAADNATLLTPDASSQQATEGQTGQTSNDAAAEGTDGDQEAPQGAPEKYEFKVQNDDFAFGQDVLAEFSTVAKELNLSQDAAQKVIDKLAPAIAQRNLERVNEMMQRTTNEWVEAVTSDKDIGGEKLNENLAVARKALDAFGSPELRALLAPFDPQKNPKGTGLGNHPEIIRAFFKAGKAISEDTFVPGSVNPNKGDRNPARALYPNQPA